MKERAAIRRGSGKWGCAEVPAKGWTLVATDDLWPEMQTCEMCEVSQIRYVHIVSHPRWRDELHVGCVCAEHLTTSSKPNEIEKALRNWSKRRIAWPGLNWKKTAKGWQLRKRSKRVVCFQDAYGRWSFVIDGAFGARHYDSLVDCKMAAFPIVDPQPQLEGATPAPDRAKYVKPGVVPAFRARYGKTGSR